MAEKDAQNYKGPTASTVSCQEAPASVETNLEFAGRKGRPVHIPLTFKRGLYQGDTLSPLLFGLALGPLSTALRCAGGFISKYQEKPVTHLVFMDDVKLFEESPEEAEAALCTAEAAARAVGMELGEAKCGVVHVRRGQVRARSGIASRFTNVKEVMDSYKYLGVEQLLGVRRGQTVKRVSDEYLKRVKMVWRSSLNSSKTVRLHNSYGVSVLRYYSPLVGLSVRQRVGLDRRTRRLLIAAKAHHPNASVDRLYLPRPKGGRGLQRVETMWEQETVSAALYTLRSEDPQVQGAKGMCSADGRRERNLIGEARSILGKHQLEAYGTDWTPTDSRSPPVKVVCGELKKRQEQETEERLHAKTIHGVYARQLAGGNVAAGASTRWLTDGFLQPQTEATIIAAQDGVTHTRAYRTRVLKKSGPAVCRMCGTGTETLGHILSSCPTHEFQAYMERHNRVLYLLVRAILSSLGLKIPKELTRPGGVARPGVYGTKQQEVRVDQLIPTKEKVSEDTQ